jgi:CHAT domain-containing protein
MGIVNQLPLLVVDALSNSDTCIVGNPHIPVFTYQNRSWNLGRLPFAEQEAQRVAFKLRVEPILGNEALKDVILSKLSSAKVVHMATHGSASNGFLVLAGSNALSESDEQFSKSVLLFPEDIEKITTRAVLVVLSSCDSGRGAVKADGIQGIARSFLLAGAQAVLTSLWRVPDESASSFMYYFYQYLVDGISSFKALQKTALSIRCYAKYSSYIHWSGYQLQGRDVQFKLGNRTSDESIRGRIGIVNTFPRLAEVLKVKKELMLKSKSHSSGESNREKDSIDWFPDRSHRTDVQVTKSYLFTL